MKRQEQRVENTWRLEDLYENEVLFSQDAEKLDAWMERSQNFRERCKMEQKPLKKH